MRGKQTILVIEDDTFIERILSLARKRLRKYSVMKILSSCISPSTKLYINFISSRRCNFLSWRIKEHREYYIWIYVIYISLNNKLIVSKMKEILAHNFCTDPLSTIVFNRKIEYTFMIHLNWIRVKDIGTWPSKISIGCFDIPLLSKPIHFREMRTKLIFNHLVGRYKINNKYILFWIK